MDYKEFAKNIKTKYPDYAGVDDRELAERVIAKYPDYKDVVTFDAEPKTGGILQKSKDAVSLGLKQAGTQLLRGVNSPLPMPLSLIANKTPQEGKEFLRESTKPRVLAQATGGTVGEVTGGVGGAALGGGAGEAYYQIAQRLAGSENAPQTSSEATKRILTAMATQGGAALGARKLLSPKPGMIHSGTGKIVKETSEFLVPRSGSKAEVVYENPTKVNLFTLKKAINKAGTAKDAVIAKFDKDSALTGSVNLEAAPEKFLEQVKPLGIIVNSEGKLVNTANLDKGTFNVLRSHYNTIKASPRATAQIADQMAENIGNEGNWGKTLNAPSSKGEEYIKDVGTSFRRDVVEPQVPGLDEATRNLGFKLAGKPFAPILSSARSTGVPIPMTPRVVGLGVQGVGLLNSTSPGVSAARQITSSLISALIQRRAARDQQR